MTGSNPAQTPGHETALDALSKPITNTSLGTADDCMADAEPMAPPTGANDDDIPNISNPLDRCSAGALIRAMHLLGSAIPGGETSGCASGG